MIQIKHRNTGEVLKEINADTLSGADLRWADLSWANLSRADLTGADLSRADLSGADLRRATLREASLRGADLRGTDLRGAYLTEATLSRDTLPEDIPLVLHLDRQILEILHNQKGDLNMRDWHTCETTHCRAGWAIVLGGEKGKELEKKYGPSVAGALIYARAYPDLPVPDFLASNEQALKDMRARAARGEG